jgi:RimJ/RimL family protein N-acetyltransferase
MPKVVLKEYKTWRDWLPLRQIQVKPNQRKFTKNIITSYLQSTHPAVTGYGVYVQENPIGYVFLIHAENPAQWIIDRMVIDKDFQRQGYGYDVVDQLIDMIYEFENSETVVARYNTDNDAARQLFVKLKFEEQEQLVRGRNIATLDFEFEESEDDDDDHEDEIDNDDEETEGNYQDHDTNNDIDDDYDEDHDINYEDENEDDYEYGDDDDDDDIYEDDDDDYDIDEDIDNTDDDDDD